MLDYIRHLRTKPEETKKQIVLVALVIAMSIVVIIWLATLGGNNTKTKESLTKEDGGKSPFSILSASFSDTFNNIKKSVGEMNIGGLKEDLLKEQQEIDKNTVNGDNQEEELPTEEKNDNFNIEE